MDRFVADINEQHEGVKKVFDINVWHLQQYKGYLLEDVASDRLCGTGPATGVGIARAARML